MSYLKLRTSIWPRWPASPSRRRSSIQHLMAQNACASFHTSSKWALSVTSSKKKQTTTCSPTTQSKRVQQLLVVVTSAKLRPSLKLSKERCNRTFNPPSRRPRGICTTSRSNRFTIISTQLTMRSNNNRCRYSHSRWWEVLVEEEISLCRVPPKWVANFSAQALLSRIFKWRQDCSPNNSSSNSKRSRWDPGWTTRCQLLCSRCRATQILFSLDRPLPRRRCDTYDIIHPL